MFSIYQKLLRPAAFSLDAETAHEIGINSLRLALSTNLALRQAERRFAVDGFGELKRFGLTFKNPLGMAAGFDKNGIVVDQLAALGFGFVEVGTVTLRPQKGNPKPRLFRLPDDEALINRLGFNNEGADAIAARLANLRRRCVVGINIGRNRDVPNEEAVENYLACFERVHGVADYVAVNVSSPNTPNLRDLQNAEKLDDLLFALQSRNNELGTKPLLLKIAPDLTDSHLTEIVELCKTHRVAGVIATNTTTSRENLRTSNVEKFGNGGLSGRPVRSLANRVISKVYSLSDGRLPVIGVGGVFTAEDAFEKIELGACLVQAYTGFVYRGPAFAREVNEGLLKLLEKRGFESLDAAVGTRAEAA